MNQIQSGEGSYRPESAAEHAGRMIVLSGCSGGGKSTLLSELGRRGYRVFEEAGRQVVREQLFIEGPALPWENVELFVELTISRSIYNLVSACRTGDPAFFDRGIIDQIAGFSETGGEAPFYQQRAAEKFRYAEIVFLMPPWRELFANDSERRHSFEDAARSYEVLKAAYARYGYSPIDVPMADVEARADFVLGMLGYSGRK